jgi:hypothetical protein
MCGSASAWIYIIFGIRTRPHWSEKMVRIQIKVKIQRLWRLKIELWKLAWRVKKWSPGGSIDQWVQIPIPFMRSRIWIRI